MARCLVIGANGFLGSHLVDELARLGHSVTAFDRFSGREPTFRVSDVTLFTGDFLNRADLEHAMAGQDYVFHFLSTTAPVTVEQEPRLDIQTNVMQTLDLLDIAVRVGTKRLFFASSGGAVYGNQGRRRYAETDPTLPVSPYGIGKLTIENFLRYYRAQRGLDSLVFRISNPYGMRQPVNRRQGLIPIALNNVLAGEPVRRFGDGSMVRDYAHVSDVVRMIGRMVGSVTEHDTYNIGSGIGHSVNDVLQGIRNVTGIDFEIETVEAPPTFVRNVVLDTRRYRREFDGQDNTSLATGIQRMWQELTAFHLTDLARESLATER